MLMQHNDRLVAHYALSNLKKFLIQLLQLQLLLLLLLAKFLIQLLQLWLLLLAKVKVKFLTQLLQLLTASSAANQQST
jgi:hypothetical protein